MSARPTVNRIPQHEQPGQRPRTAPTARVAPQEQHEQPGQRPRTSPAAGVAPQQQHEQPGQHPRTAPAAGVAPQQQHERLEQKLEQQLQLKASTLANGDGRRGWPAEGSTDTRGLRLVGQVREVGPGPTFVSEGCHGAGADLGGEGRWDSPRAHDLDELGRVPRWGSTSGGRRDCRSEVQAGPASGSGGPASGAAEDSRGRVGAWPTREAHGDGPWGGGGSFATQGAVEPVPVHDPVMCPFCAEVVAWRLAVSFLRGLARGSLA